MGTGVGEAMLIGAVTGAGTSAITGGDPLKGALFGAAGGAFMPGAGSMLGGAPAGTVGSAAGSAGTSAAMNAVPAAASQSAFQAALPELGVSAASSAVPTTMATPFQTALADLGVQSASAVPSAAIPAAAAPTVTPQTGFMDIFKGVGDSDTRGFGQRVGDYIVQNPKMAAAIGGGAMNTLFNNPEVDIPGEEKYKGPLSRFRYNPDTYRPAYAGGGGITDIDLGTRAQLSSSPVTMMASGGISDLGGYSDGGRLLKGPGDGMSDSIPAKIGRKQPARLADGEFVVPADVVSHLGNGSTDAGAKQLYAMMDKVRRARTGTKKQGKEINPRKYVPA